MKILLDTNILIDVYLKRQEHFEKSYVAYLESISAGNECIVSAKSIMDMHYVMKKKKCKKDLYETIEKTINLASILDLTVKDIIAAVNNEGKDFEDDVLVASAQRIGVDCIITRNKKDFKKTGIKVMTPDEYLKSVHKEKWRVHENAAQYYSVEEVRA